MQADRVFKEFRARFIGKCSPVHLFWGAPGPRGHAVLRAPRSRASGRHPEPAGLGDPRSLLARGEQLRLLGRAAGAISYPAFYSYAYPEPAGFAQAPVKPEAAFYITDLREFILPYDAVRQSKDPDATLLEFLQTTYEAAANLAQWDRAALERTPQRENDRAHDDQAVGWTPAAERLG